MGKNSKNDREQIMQNVIPVAEDLLYVGGSDRKISLFENLYPVPKGVSYNSYLLLDEQTALFDTVDASAGDLFLENVARALGGRGLDYLVIHHMEPDHSATVRRLVGAYPDVTVVTSRKAAEMLGNYFPAEEFRIRTVGEGDVLCTGKHSFTFLGAPMVHWPEVLMSFDSASGALFSADAFGTFGALSGSLFADEADGAEWLEEARRYYFNIVGKYGVQVQAVLKKAAQYPVKRIYPLHGPIWREDLSLPIEKYDLWSRYLPEERGAVLFCGSMHGHTAAAADLVAAALAGEGVNAKVYDVSRTDPSVLLAEAFRYSHAVFLSATQNLGIFRGMKTLLSDLAAHNFQNRKYALVENGSWAPQAGALMQKALMECRGLTQLGETVTILSSVKEGDLEKLSALAKTVAEDIKRQ